MSFGVVLFDENRATSGWASIDGGPARRINGIGNLESDVLWWTSLSFSDFYSAGLSRLPNIRNADYLRSSMSQIIDECGLKTRFVKPADAAQSLSEIFTRVMLMAKSMYGLSNYSKERLCDDLREVLLPADRSMSDEIDKASSLAYQTFTKCTVNSVKTTKNIQFKIPRMKHAADVLSTPMPGDQWEYIERKKLPEKKNRVSWAVNNERPILAEIVVSDVSNDIANIIAFGSGSNNFRRWITHPELIMLSKYAKIEIDSVFIFDEYQPIRTNFPPPISKGISSLSISAGLLAENYWVGLANPQLKPAGVKIHSPRASWLRAADRAFSLIPALTLHSAGVQVKSYGVGSVMLGVPKGNLAEVISLAGKAGLLPPMTAPEDAVIQEDLA